MQKEILIIRNTTIQRLFDLICVDFAKEEVEYIATQLEYEQAVGMLVELEKSLELEENI